MCIKRYIIHTKCCGNHRDRTIVRCNSPSCTSNLDVDVRSPTFHIQLTGIEQTRAMTRCRACRRSRIMARWPDTYRNDLEYGRLFEEMRLNSGFDLEQQRLRLRPRTHPEHAVHLEVANSLPAVRSEELREEDRCCPICECRYGEVMEGQEGFEGAVKLGCNHVMGRRCVLRILETGNHKCPFCRTMINRVVPGSS